MTEEINEKIKIEEKIEPLKLDWEYFWKRDLLKNNKKEKNWNDIADEYSSWIENDDYPEKLIKQMRISKKDSVLDLGCGEGTITINLAKKAKSITAYDASEKMLANLEDKAKNENLNNITTINNKIENLNSNNIPKHDIIVASRSLNGIFNIKNRLDELNKIANKYVYITLFGSSNNKYKEETAELIGKKLRLGSDYIYVYHILKSMGIEANIIKLECENLKEYKTLDEAVNRAIWKLGKTTEENQIKLKNYFKNKFIKNKRGNWVNPHDKADWILIWWKIKE